jgi:hypothetical protein
VTAACCACRCGEGGVVRGGHSRARSTINSACCSAKEASCGQCQPLHEEVQDGQVNMRLARSSAQWQQATRGMGCASPPGCIIGRSYMACMHACWHDLSVNCLEWIVSPRGVQVPWYCCFRLEPRRPGWCPGGWCSNVRRTCDCTPTSSKECMAGAHLRACWWDGGLPEHSGVCKPCGQHPCRLTTAFMARGPFSMAWPCCFSCCRHSSARMDDGRCTRC